MVSAIGVVMNIRWEAIPYREGSAAHGGRLDRQTLAAPGQLELESDEFRRAELEGLRAHFAEARLEPLMQRYELLRFGVEGGIVVRVFLAEDRGAVISAVMVVVTHAHDMPSWPKRLP